MTGESPFCNGTRSGTFETSIQRHNGMFYTYYQKIQEENSYDRVPARYL